MRSLFPLSRLSLLCCALCFSAPLGSAAEQAQSVLTAKSLRLVWKATFAGQQILKLGPSGANKMVVFTAPPWDAKQADWNAWPLTPVVIDLETGRQAKQAQITGFRGEALADEQRWYAVIPLPLPPSNGRPIDPKEFRAELAAFDWADRREAWRIPCEDSEEPLVLGDLLFHTATQGEGGPFNRVIATDVATGQEVWHRSGGMIRGMFLANNRLYLYNESQDTGVADTQGEFLNALDPKTGEPLQRLRFYPEFRPLSSLGSLAWFPQAQRWVGTFEVHTPGQDVTEIRALDAAGTLVWSRADTSGFHVINGVLVCERKRTGIIALDPADGHELWQRPGSENRVLTAWNDTAVVRSGPDLLALDSRSGKIVWTLPTPVLPPDRLPASSTRKGDVSRLWPTDISLRAYGPYLAIAQTRTEGRNAALSLYTLPDR